MPDADDAGDAAGPVLVLLLLLLRLSDFGAIDSRVIALTILAFSRHEQNVDASWLTQESNLRRDCVILLLLLCEKREGE